MRSNSERLKTIQSALGVEPDGVLGAVTLTALERRLKIAVAKRTLSQNAGLTLTAAGIQAIIDFEIGSKAYYESALQQPIWPGGDSGVTIGIGYDLGYQTRAQFQSDWAGYIHGRDVEKLSKSCGRKGRVASLYIRRFSRISIPYDAAFRVFVETSLPSYAEKTKQAFPGVEQLSPSAQAGLVSLVYNRGASLSGARRAEMLAIRDLVVSKDYAGIAQQIRNMKRLWQGRGLDGLLKRRDVEADLVEQGTKYFSENEVVYV